MVKLKAKQSNTDFISKVKGLCFPICFPACFQRDRGIGKVKQDNESKFKVKQDNESKFKVKQSNK